MSALLQVLVSGIMIGGLYGLFSSGLSLVFGITRIVNFAHGDFVTIGMYGAIVGAMIGLNPLESLLPVAVLMFGIGAVIYFLALRPRILQKGRGDDEVDHTQLVITLGVSLIIENGLQLAFSPNSRSVNFLQGTINAFGIYINETQLVAFLISIVAFGLLYLWMTRTDFGKAIQASVDDIRSATLVGIDTGKIYLVTFGVGAALAAIAGSVMITYFPVIPTTGVNLVAIAFVVVVLGGLGNVAGAFLAGIVIGIAQQITATYVSMDLQNVGIFLVFVLALIFLPQGLMGRKVAK